MKLIFCNIADVQLGDFISVLHINNPCRISLDGQKVCYKAPDDFPVPGYAQAYSQVDGVVILQSSQWFNQNDL